MTGVRCSLAALPDLFADRDAAGKEDVIKSLMQQCLILCASAFDDGDVFPREAGGDQLADDGGGRGEYADGLRMQQLPAASAPISGSISSMNG